MSSFYTLLEAMFLFHKMMSFAAHCWCISDKCYKCWSITKCCGSCSYQYLKVVLVLLSVSQCCGQCHIVVTQALINITMLCLFSCQYHNAVLVLISIALAQCCARGSLRHHYVITSSTTWPFSTPLHLRHQSSSRSNRPSPKYDISRNVDFYTAIQAI